MADQNVCERLRTKENEAYEKARQGARQPDRS